MPIKEIFSIASIIVGGWYITEGRVGMWKQIHKFQYAVMKDLGKTSNWGNPSIFRQHK